MPSPQTPGAPPGEPKPNGEIARLNKIIQALMDRAERSTVVQGSDFGLFQTAIMLEGQVRSRTAELEAALRKNEDITRALRESEAKFHGLVNQSLVGITMIEDGKFSYANEKFRDIFGYGPDEALKMAPWDVAVEEDRPLVAENVRKRVNGEVEHVQYEFRGRRKDGAQINVEVYGSTMKTGGKAVLISLVMDITERTRIAREIQALQEQLRELSVRDALTGLYNRRYLEEMLSRELIVAERQDHPVSIIMSDLDHFKVVNDKYGHLAGDEVLKAYAALMRRHARASDIGCRYGGEEFLLVLPQMPADLAVARAEQLRDAFATTPTPYGGSVIPVTASFGVATFPLDGRTIHELIAAADSALYTAKASGRDRVEARSTPGQAKAGTLG